MFRRFSRRINMNFMNKPIFNANNMKKLLVTSTIMSVGVSQDEKDNEQLQELRELPPIPRYFDEDSVEAIQKFKAKLSAKTNDEDNVCIGCNMWKAIYVLNHYERHKDECKYIIDEFSYLFDETLQKLLDEENMSAEEYGKCLMAQEPKCVDVRKTHLVKVGDKLNNEPERFDRLVETTTKLVETFNIAYRMAMAKKKQEEN